MFDRLYRWREVMMMMMYGHILSWTRDGDRHCRRLPRPEMGLATNETNEVVASAWRD
jgi:hypothetical protein